MFTFCISSSICSLCILRGNKLDKDTEHVVFRCVIFVHIVLKVHLYFSTERTKILQDSSNISLYMVCKSTTL